MTLPWITVVSPQVVETRKRSKRCATVDGPLLKQNGISQTRSSHFVKGRSIVTSKVIRGEKDHTKKNKKKGKEKQGKHSDTAN